MLIIDDFGRQVISPRYLLNRWIVPLDRRVDYLTLRYGVKFQIPFEMLVVFSTNLEPKELAEEAFAEVLRRLCIDLGGKELRACYPADILNILISICRYHELPVEISRANLEKAATLYFTKTMTMQQEPP
jgi:hypothetical protein